MTLLFAATYPERTAAAILYGTGASHTRADDYPWAPTSGGVGELMLPTRSRRSGRTNGWTVASGALSPSIADDPEASASGGASGC